MKCVNCGKTLEKVPNWFSDVDVSFVCNNCPNRQVMNITQLDVTDIVGGEAEEANAEEAKKKEAGKKETKKK